MNCKIFIDNLEKYILEDISDDLKIEMEEHIKSCMKCRELYNEEMLFRQAVEEAFNCDDVVFTSQKDSIMEKIDHDRYKKNIVRKSKGNFRRYIQIGAPIAAAVAFIVMINPISKFNIGNNSKQDKVNVAERAVDKEISSQSKIAMDSVDKKQGKIEEKELKKDKKENSSAIVRKEEDNKQTASVENQHTEKATIDDNKSSEGSNNNSKENIKNSNEDLFKGDKGSEEDRNLITMALENEDEFNKESLNSEIQFEKKSIEEKLVLQRSNKWYNSPDRRLSYCVVEKEYKSIENDTNKLYIKDLKNNSEWSLKIIDSEAKNLIKYVKWSEDGNLFVVSEVVKENKVQNEELYLLNACTGKALKVYKTENNEANIVDIEKSNENNIKIKLKMNNNNDSNENSIEDYTIYNVQNGIINNDKEKQ
ncbi:DUF4652 domain-containing protein [Clostridium ganghwense]|uniref:DUF4652 domain-containing protein n=1 Tax=Clostridium ganghwense TaxID=312089 RepID=A0ABT4CR18_9CLOT|nr:DUF4652 domain-containing protein [Clostridium ganghwense]MCY6371513.1 DUF4652 domain-containing protein [Clostridium ganghwense]